jgi:predicted CxxxxCH...CXXCH cytochrome family protein
MRNRIAVIVIVAGCTLWICCAKSENPVTPESIGTSASASCDECHAYPGSILCKTDTAVDSRGMVFTKCSACHAGSITIDSSFSAASNGSLYHDQMFSANGKNYPHTDSTHADGKKTLKFIQCTFCHSFPPNTGGHKTHVIDQGKSCFECHFATMRHDTGYDSSVSPADMFFTQYMQTVPGGFELPVPDQAHHIDNVVEVSFRKKYQRPAVPDSMFAFTPFDKSCSNIACHSGIANGGASVERTLWREKTP